MAELAHHALVGSSHDPTRVSVQARRPSNSIQPSLIPADEPVGQRFQVVRNPNEVNNVNLNNRHRIGSISRAGLS